LIPISNIAEQQNKPYLVYHFLRTSGARVAMKRLSGGVIGGAVFAFLALSQPASAVTVTLEGEDSRSGSLVPQFSLLDLQLIGAPATNSFVTNMSGNIGGITYSFLGGSGGTSGIYAGGQPIAASPYTDADQTTKYFSAEGGGSVKFIYNSAQTTLNILWGTVDSTDTRNLITTNGVNGVQTISGGDILSACGLSCSDGNTEVWVTITGLNSFTSLTFSDNSANAFEFNVGAPTGGPFTNGTPGGVPEPSTWAMLVVGFAGIGFMSYRRKAKPVLMAT
jgi:hypothetical protein